MNNTTASRLDLYLDLIRWDRPAGWLLLLWPTLSALWIAADGWPGWHLLLVFVFGTVLMRSAGCCVNDVADREFDRHVKRTAQRPGKGAWNYTRQSRVSMFGMDTMTFNKIAGAVIGTGLLVMGLNIVSDSIYHAEKPEETAIKIDVPETGDTAVAGADAKPAVSIATLLASADAAKGETAFKACQACHVGEKDGANKVGPHLWDIVNRPIASISDYSYDDALKSKSADKWTFENLSEFIKKPKTFAPGTKMGFGGIGDDAKRADLLAYLRTLADTPAELPAPEAAAPAAASTTESAATAAPATATAAETAPSAPATQVATAAGDAAKGEAAFRACKACHSSEKGGPNKVGPHLWDVVNRLIASVSDYNYDDALKSKSAEKWTPENLDAFIKKPKDYAPGTKMTFGGISDDGKRADLIAYLRSLSDNPQ